MPVDPNHRYADEAHPSTMTGAGWRYACWTLSDEYRRDRPGVDAGAGRVDRTEKGWSKFPAQPEARGVLRAPLAQVDKAMQWRIAVLNSHASQ